MCFFIAELSVGQSAEASVAETMSAFAPLVIAAWIAGICEAEVAWVPLVSVPFSPSAFSAASAPPDLTLSAVVKYGLPRFLGMTKTLRPFLSGFEADAAGSAARSDTAATTATPRETRLCMCILSTNEDDAGSAVARAETYALFRLMSMV